MKNYIYYVYYLIDSSTGIPFYVGKGKGDRMYSHVHAVKVNRKGYFVNKHLYNKISKLLKENIKIEYKKIYHTNNEEKAYQREEEEIKKIGLDKLCNIVPGGNGIKFTKEIREKMSISLKGKNTWNKGTHRTEETKRKISENAKINPNYGMKGKHFSEETKQKMSKSHEGILPWNTGLTDIFHHSEETKKKISETMKGLLPWNTGLTNIFHHSKETKRKISETLKKRKIKEKNKT